MSYRDAFPHIPALEMPSIPALWTDISYRNDSCPHFLAHSSPTGRVVVWVDREDADQREIPGPRFTVVVADLADEDDHCAEYQTDRWTVALAYVDGLAEAMRLQYAAATERDGDQCEAYITALENMFAKKV
jgi:hypothetical protein